MKYHNLLQLLIFLFCIAWQSQAASQDVYKVIDENGKVTYTDNPRGDKNAEPIKIKSTNTQPAIQPGPKTSPPQTKSKATNEYNLAITSPANETHLTPGQWDLSVTVTIEPALANSHFLQLFDNNNPIGSPQKDNTFNITNISRGSHELQAHVVSDRGRVLKRSDTITVYVHRVSVKK